MPLIETIRDNKYGTDFIIPLVVDEKFLDMESHSLMSVNWQNTSPSHFLRNPTFGVISTTERLFSKTSNYRLRLFRIFSLAKMGVFGLTC